MPTVNPPAGRAGGGGLVCLALALVLLAPTADACGCGIALKASVTRERALVVVHPGREEIVASFDLRDDATGRAAVVLPVPGDPVVRAQAHGDPLAYLDRATARPATAGAGGDLDTARAQPGVDVIGREEVGGYDVSRLRAGDPRELAAWLHDNGYVLPAGAAPILADYVRAGWRYVAIRLAPGSAGRLRPLRIAFPSRRAVYPMRLTQLGSEPVNLTLYVLASGRRATPGLSTAWKGRVSELPERPPPELRRLIPEGAYLTKLVAEGVAPRRFTRDLTLAATRSPGARDDGGGGIRWWEITGLALLGLVAAGALARRHTGRR